MKIGFYFKKLFGLLLLLISTYLEWQRSRARGCRGFKSFFPPADPRRPIG